MNVTKRLLLPATLFALTLCSVAQNTTNGKAAPSKPDSPATASTSLPSEATMNAFLKQMFGWNQELSWKVEDIKPSEAPGIAQATVVFNTPKGPSVTRIYVTPDQKFAFTGELVPFGVDPFAKTREDLKAASGPMKGPANAAVTIVEFGDLECPACKAAQPNITKLMEEEPKAKLIFQNFPLTTVHKWAMTAAKYVTCLASDNNDAAVKFIATVYDHQAEVNEQNVEQMLKGYVKEVGGNPDAVAACVAKPETEKRIQQSIDLGQKLDVTSTPTFFINGRRIVGFNNPSTPYDAIKTMVDYDINNPAGK